MTRLARDKAANLLQAWLEQKYSTLGNGVSGSTIFARSGSILELKPSFMFRKYL
jgi:hypothetical protein